ncbi:MAG: PAS domain S-box protein [Sediminibacterium magnilacihabitans]|jgi:PAS domain S-box-containing protein|nr:PAS domain S-box protein [Sediminibacterium magnilacihabitans]
MSDHYLQMNILIVEDNPGDLFLLEELLGATSLPVARLFRVTNATQAISVLQLQKINLVLLDLTLPDSDGLESYKIINQYAVSIPIIVLTGMIDMHVALETMANGAQDYLIKGEFDEKLLSKSIQYSIERKRNLENLRESNERYEFVTKATNDMVWDWNLDTNEIYWAGENIYKLYGYQVTDFKTSADFWEKCIHPDDRQRVIDGLFKSISSNTHSIWQDEFRFRKADGTYAHVVDKGYLLYHGQTPRRMIGAMQDITDRKLAELKVINSERRFRSLVQNGSDMIKILDEDGHFTFSSPTVEKVLGYTPSTLVGRNLFDFIHPDDMAFIRKRFKQISQQPSLEISSFRFKNADGEWRWLEAKLTNLIEDPSVRGIVSNSRDVTEKKQMEKKLQEERQMKQKEITEAVIREQEKERYEISKELHDNVNQQLTVAMMYLATALKGSDNHQELLKQSSGFIFNAIEEIRKLSKALVTPLIKDFGLAKAIDGLVEDILVANQMSIEFFYESFYEEDINYEFKLNIFRIVQEQINNIIKHANANCVTIELYRDDFIRLSITDNGKGFDTAVKRKGIGINNIFSRVELYNGSIELKSAPNKGCQLHIVFPAGREILIEPPTQTV